MYVYAPHDVDRREEERPEEEGRGGKGATAFVVSGIQNRETARAARKVGWKAFPWKEGDVRNAKRGGKDDCREKMEEEVWR